VQESSDSEDEAKERAAKKMIEILTKYQAKGEKNFSIHKLWKG
jgi:hypothetical protein